MKYIFILSFLLLTSCAGMGEYRQIQYDLCDTDSCRALIKIEDREDKRYEAAERKVMAYELFRQLPRLCRAAGMSMAFTCDPASKVCGRLGKSLTINDYSIHELSSAGCMHADDFLRY